MKTLSTYLAVLCGCLMFGQVFATEMESPNYRLESGTIEMSQEEVKGQPEDNSPARMNTVLSANQQQLFQANGYVFLHNPSSQEQLTFTLSNGTVEFTDLTANPIQEMDIVVNTSNTASLPSSLYLQQETPFISPNGKQIASTLCQKTSTVCTATTARQWTDKQVFGLGYKIDGIQKPIDFIGKNYYRSFNKPSQTNRILTYRNNGSSSSLTFKLNIPVELSESSYETTISLFIIPQPY